MTRDQLNNIIVQAFAKGVEASLSPMPPHIRLDKDHMVDQVNAYLVGKARMHALSIINSPSVAAALKD